MEKEESINPSESSKSKNEGETQSEEAENSSEKQNRVLVVGNSVLHELQVTFFHSNSER